MATMKPKPEKSILQLWQGVPLIDAIRPILHRL